MIEQGIQRLIQADAAVLALCAAGGYLAEVPKGRALPSWCYRFFGGTPVNAQNTVGGLTMRRLEIDVIADEGGGGGLLSLAAAIDAVLDGFRGPLPDDDQTLVDSCLKAEEPRDHMFDFERRGLRRVLEYEIWFYDE